MLTRQRKGYLHIVDFINPLRLKKLAKRLYFLTQIRTKLETCGALDTKAIPFKGKGAAVRVRGAAHRARLVTVVPVSRLVVKAWRPSCERPG